MDTRAHTAAPPLRAGRPAASWPALYGSPDPLGATWLAQEQAFNFALYSKHATTVKLLGYAPGEFTTPVFELGLHPLKNKSGRIWHCRIPAADLQGAAYYAYQVDGPAPAGGYELHRFDAQKILLDPYARQVFFPPDFDRQAASRPGSNAGRAPLGKLVRAAATMHGGSSRPLRHGHDLVIYEMHVRGFTRNANSGVTSPRRGTFLGVIDKIPHLQELGITAVELMPVHQFDPQEGNYFGYMTLNFFAPHQGYATTPAGDTAQEEFREMVRALHAAGIEVYLDVVYNHTAEGDHRGPVYSFKGIDNSSYYMLNYGNNETPYSNGSGCGNTMLSVNHAVQRLIADSMRYWVQEMDVDGFRFDLASTLAEDVAGRPVDYEHPLFDQIAADPVLNQVRLIAEQWGMDRVKFPGRAWWQWNGEYRDCIRHFVKGDASHAAAMASRLYGSADLLSDALPFSFRPYQSVNYIASHDGFTLNDLVSYTHRTDRTDDEYQQYGWGCGHEGVDGVPPEVLALRKRQVRNFWALLLLSNGTPMIRMGDEFMQTQRGHGDPYAIDSELSWVDWDLKAAHADVFAFLRRMIAFRKAHPTISRSSFWREDVSWHGPAGAADFSEHSLAFAYCLRGGAEEDADLYVMINAYWEPIPFAFQQPGPWRMCIDTARTAPEDIQDPGTEPLVEEGRLVQARSVVVCLRPVQA